MSSEYISQKYKLISNGPKVVFSDAKVDNVINVTVKLRDASYFQNADMTYHIAKIVLLISVYNCFNVHQVLFSS